MGSAMGLRKDPDNPPAAISYIFSLTVSLCEPLEILFQGLWSLHELGNNPEKITRHENISGISDEINHLEEKRGTMEVSHPSSSSQKQREKKPIPRKCLLNIN